VVALLSAMKVFNDLSPPYASTVFVELYNSSAGNLTVEIWYKNTSAAAVTSANTTDLFQLTIPGKDYQHCCHC